MSYTDAHPAAIVLECRTCQCRVSGDEIAAVTVGLFRDAHDGHDALEEGVE